MRGYTNLQLHRIIFRAMSLLIALNARKYGKGASRELLRDLLGELNTPTTATTARKRPMAASA
jgi:hypothetical protein